MVFHSSVMRHWLLLAGIALGLLAIMVSIMLSMVMQRRPTPAEREVKRRLNLAENGRIVDGSLIDAAPSEKYPQAIIYQYRIGGVTYECAQDLTTLPATVENVKLDYPVQVRYNRLNPADSIVISETWNGLWSDVLTPGGSPPEN